MATPLEIVMSRKNKPCCRNCRNHVEVESENKTEGIKYVNFCNKSGKLILEMHMESIRDCCEK